MKNQFKIYLISATVFFAAISSGFSQFIPNLGVNFWGETDNSQKIEAIGIGDYGVNSAQPNAALDITIPYLFPNTPPLIYQGEAIRSSAASDFDHTWKMFTFPETPKFFVLNLGQRSKVKGHAIWVV